MSGRARRKSVKRYIKYLKKGSRFRFARQLGRFNQAYGAICKDIYNQDNIILNRLKERFPNGIVSPEYHIIDKPLVFGEAPEE